MPSPSTLCAYAAVGLALAVAWLLVSTTCAAVLVFADWRRAARAGLHHEPGALLAAEIGRSDRRLRRHGMAALLFLVSVGLLVALGDHDAPAASPLWLELATAAVTVAAAVLTTAKVVNLWRYRGRLRRLLEADRAVAERLGEVQRRGHRVFHAVCLDGSSIDHVVVGSIGVFAVQVVVPPRAGATSVALVRGALVFAPEGGEMPLRSAVESFARLGKALGQLVGHPVKVVPSLVVPGCRIASLDEDRYLLANESNCVAMVGWKDSEAYLMDEEVERISAWLSARSRADGRRSWPARRRALHVCAARPALV